MKKYLIFLLIPVLLFSCTKRDLVPENLDPQQFMQTREAGQIAYVDYFSGNYIVQTNSGYAVVQSWSGVTPREMDLVYAHFSMRGTQTMYNRSGNYFTQIRVYDSWLSWFEALEIIDWLGTGGF